MTLRFEQPAYHHETAFIAALRDFERVGEWVADEYYRQKRDFCAFVDALRKAETHPRPHHVPESFFWLFDDDTWVGAVSLRHELDEVLAEFGGHISYEVRPSLRRRGFGLMLCRFILRQAQQRGMSAVLITCDEDNIGSQKIIEACGGVLQDVHASVWYKRPVRRYWITLTSGAS